MLNRAGTSIFWNSNNENLINFLKCFCESFFFQKTLLLFLSNRLPKFITFIKIKKLFNKKIVFKKNQKNNFYVKFLKKFKLVKKYKKFFKFLYKQKSIKCYFTKVFFLSYSNWVIVTVRIYKRYKKIFIFKKKKINLLLLWKFFFFNNFKKNNF